MKDAKGHGSEKGAHQGGIAQVGQAPLTKPESPESQNLRLFGDNDGDLHRQSFQPVVSNLSKKMDKGVYDSAKGAVLWGYHADKAAQAYAKQMPSGQPWHKQFPTSVRKEAAGHWERENAGRIKRGEFK